jgi:hypothetical protein
MWSICEMTLSGENSTLGQTDRRTDRETDRQKDMCQFINISLSSTGKIFSRIYSNSFFWDYNKNTKKSLFRYVNGGLQETKNLELLIDQSLGWSTDFHPIL